MGTTKKVSLWMVELNEAKPLAVKWTSILDRHEQDKANSFRFEIHRNAYIRSHLALRLILGDRMSIRPERVIINQVELEKPVIDVPPNFPQIDFSLSHTNGFALIGLTSQGKIGVDIESRQNRTDQLKIASEWFSPEECEMLQNMSNIERETGFLSCWTIKEAYSKAIGKGLSQNLAGVVCNLAPTGIASQISVEDNDNSRQWGFRSVYSPTAIGTVLTNFIPDNYSVNWLSADSTDSQNLRGEAFPYRITQFGN